MDLKSLLGSIATRELRILGSALTLLATLPLEAQLGSRPAEAWIKVLESPQRLEQLKINETVAELNLKPGDRVADIGAGSGLFCPPLAKAVSPTGILYAVDIEQDLLDHIASRAQILNITNIQTVRGRFTDPNLPTHDLDLAFLFDVLHHIEQRQDYLRNLTRYLKPAGHIAIVDFHPGQGPHPDEPELQVTKAQTDAWMSAIGWEPWREIKLFDDKWFVIYLRTPTTPP